MSIDTYINTLESIHELELLSVHADNFNLILAKEDNDHDHNSFLKRLWYSFKKFIEMVISKLKSFFTKVNEHFDNYEQEFNDAVKEYNSISKPAYINIDIIEAECSKEQQHALSVVYNSVFSGIEFKYTIEPMFEKLELFKQNISTNFGITTLDQDDYAVKLVTMNGFNDLLKRLQNISNELTSENEPIRTCRNDFDEPIKTSIKLFQLIDKLDNYKSTITQLENMLGVFSKVINNPTKADEYINTSFDEMFGVQRDKINTARDSISQFLKCLSLFVRVSTKYIKLSTEAITTYTKLSKKYPDGGLGLPVK